MSKLRRPEQIRTHPVSTTTIMRAPGFLRGVNDKRAGRPPRFDANDDDLWSYERGRAWATIAPRKMPVLIGRRVNPAAILIFLREDIL